MGKWWEVKKLCCFSDLKKGIKYLGYFSATFNAVILIVSAILPTLTDKLLGCSNTTSEFCGGIHLLKYEVKVLEDWLVKNYAGSIAWIVLSNLTGIFISLLLVAGVHLGHWCFVWFWILQKCAEVLMFAVTGILLADEIWYPLGENYGLLFPAACTGEFL